MYVPVEMNQFLKQSTARTSEIDCSSTVRIVHGATDVELGVAGHSVGEVQSAVAQILNVAPECLAFVNGRGVDERYIVPANSRLEFLAIHGRKGALSKSDLEQLQLPKEVSCTEASQILECDAKTVLRYIRQGLLEWRDTATPSSSRPHYRIKLESVLKVRTSYRVGSPIAVQRVNPQSQRRTAARSFESKHIKVNRGI